MNGFAKDDDKNSGTFYAFFIAVVFFVFASAGLGALIWKHSSANACSGESKESLFEHVSGIVRKDPERTNWYINGTHGSRLIYQCGRGRCSLYKQLSSSINQAASATFCQGELVTLDIGPERVFTRQSSSGYLYSAALWCVGAVAFVFILFRFGDKKLSLGQLFGRAKK